MTGLDDFSIFQPSMGKTYVIGAFGIRGERLFFGILWRLTELSEMFLKT